MLWRRCEFRGGNRVQRGKYPGFQTDSEVLFVTVLSPARHGAESEPKKAVARPSYRLGADPESEGVKRENRGLEWLRSPVIGYGFAEKPTWLLGESSDLVRDRFSMRRIRSAPHAAHSITEASAGQPGSELSSPRTGQQRASHENQDVLSALLHLVERPDLRHAGVDRAVRRVRRR